VDFGGVALIPVDCCWGGIKKMGMYNNKLQNIRQTMQATACEIEYKPALQQSPASKQNTTIEAGLASAGSRHSHNVFVFVFHNDTSGLLCKSSCLSRSKYHRVLLSLFPLYHSSSPLSSPRTLPTKPLPALLSRDGDQKIKIRDSHH
jgi:hypothetical protein